MTKVKLSPQQTQALVKATEPADIAVASTGPSSYWQRVWQQLRADRACLLALLLLGLLLAMSFGGHWLWPQDPHLQNSANRFAPATASRQAQIVEDASWAGQVQPVATLTVVAANTQFVRLQWPQAWGQPVQVYRKPALQAEGWGRLITTPTTAYMEDRFALPARALVYSVVSSNGDLLGQVDVVPALAVSRFYATMTGLANSDEHTVMLPAHPLGTDSLGRDTLARLLAGGRITLGIGILAPLLATVFGLFYGAVSGYVGGRTDEIMMRFADFVIALPFLLFVILLNVALGYGPQSSGVMAMFIALALMGWPNCAKLVRGQVLSLREAAYVDAAKLLGGSPLYIIRVHLLPSVLGAVLVALSFAIPSAIFTEALLSFIGLGVKAPQASWGSMCQEAINELQRHPMQLVYPAALISSAVLAFNMLGDSLRDALAAAGGQYD